MRPSFPERFRRLVTAAALLLGVGLIGGEGLVMGLAIWAPQVGAQYRAVFLTHERNCWLPQNEQAVAKTDPMLLHHPGVIRIDQLDHREACSLLPQGWSSETHRTPDGQVYSRGATALILLPILPGQSAATLTLEGYAPPAIADRVEMITIHPKVDGVAAPFVTLERSARMLLRLPLPPTDRPRLVTIILDLPQPGWMHPLSMSDDPQYAGVVLRSIARD
jgi:hypothetical protein